MIRALPLLALLVGCAPKNGLRKYDNSLFELASGYSAKMMCSCLWVADQDEDACAEWSRVSPDIARYRVDTDARTVTARALGMGRTTARYVDEQLGCAIVEE